MTQDHDVALVLAALAECHDRWGRVGAQTVADHLGFDVLDVAYLLYQLEQDGLVIGHHDPDLPTVWVPAGQ